MWRPARERVRRAKLTAFMGWLEEEGLGKFSTYADLWRWSVEDLEQFWEAIRRYWGVGGSEATGPVLVRSGGTTSARGAESGTGHLRDAGRGAGAEGAEWYPTLSINYVDGLLDHPGDDTALVAVTETGRRTVLSYDEVRSAAGSLAASLGRLGVVAGDRVAAVMTNSAEVVIAFLATASIGAVWSSCAPEFGPAGMLDRLGQISPKVLFMTGGYRFGGRWFSMDEKLAALEAGLPGLVATVVVDRDEESSPVDRDEESSPSSGGQADDGVRRMHWDEMLAVPAPLVPVAVPFSHPLWILYSSGTTGLPKPIVHGHGGIVLEHRKALALHCDLGPSDRFFWFTTTGWMMWNFLVGGLLVGATIVCYDGSPTWPGEDALWRLARDERITFFGTSAPYIEACRRSRVSPRGEGPLRELRAIGSTGSPLSPEGFEWAASEVGDDVLVASMSGGTDVCTGFFGPCPLLAVRAGELQCAMLGVRAEAFDDAGRSVVGEVGELVVTEPMPSMPLYLWGDTDGRRLHETYFEPNPGIWRHGDWVRLTPEGGAVIYGRSDATLNRGGVRAGTAEFYRVVEALDEVADSLVVDTTELGREGRIVLVVVPRSAPEHSGTDPDRHGDLADVIRRAVRTGLSPRHVPDDVIVVGALPRTVNGKKLEVPVRRILLGARPDEAFALAAVDRPEAVAELIEGLACAGLLRE